MHIEFVRNTYTCAVLIPQMNSECFHGTLATADTKSQQNFQDLEKMILIILCENMNPFTMTQLYDDTNVPWNKVAYGTMVPLAKNEIKSTS